MYINIYTCIHKLICISVHQLHRTKKIPNKLYLKPSTFRENPVQNKFHVYIAHLNFVFLTNAFRLVRFMIALLEIIKF